MTIHIPAKTPTNHRLKDRLSKAIQGDVLFDAFSRGRYSTDASIYQIEPVGVVVPKTLDEVRIAAEIAREEGITLLPRGGGTSQSGQTVGRSLVIDFTKHLRRVISTDFEARTCIVEPGIALDELNRQIKASGLWFPVDVSTSSRATIGGMAGNNSCGTRSLRYGIMRDNVVGMDALLADGTRVKFGANSPSPRPSRGEGQDPDKREGRPQGPEPVAAPHPNPLPVSTGRGDVNALAADLFALGATNAEHIRQAFPEVSRRVGGYLIDALLPEAPPNLATLLLGSEGTLAITERVELKLSPQPKNRALGVCHFPTFRAAMEAAQHIVKLGPVAVELVDKNLIELARDIAMFRPVMEQFVRGKPDALLLVEFAEPDQAENLRRLDQLAELMGDLGFPQSVVKVSDSAQQTSLWGVRTAGLNIMMSMRSEGKPVSFIEDCAVPLEHLADYTERLTAIFAKYGTTGTWYAHASVGCLHVRPVLNLKLDQDAKTMRAIAEEAFTMVKEYKGSHSGEHGDGLVRSEFHELMYGRKTVELFEAVKDRFDPKGLMNPGKIVRAPAMNDRTLFRYKPDYGVSAFAPKLDWSGYASGAQGLQGAVEMCNNNGECRKTQGGAMCPSFRVTRDEKDSTRGRANSLRLALSGQLGPDALGSDDMLDTMKLCVSCKACRSECPTGVDMAKMKIEVLAAANQRRGLSLRDRLVGYLPRYASYARRFAGLVNLRDKVPGAARLSEMLTGFSAKRPLPVWQSDAFLMETSVGPANGREVAFFADTFNSNFDNQTLRDAVDVLAALGYRVTQLHSEEGRRVCCGRTFLSAGLVEEAKAEASRFLDAVRPFVKRGVPIIGLEPSCMMSFRDEIPGMLPGPETKALTPLTFLFEEFLAAELAAGRIKGPIARQDAKVLLHGHCHQKSFGAMPATMKALSLVQGFDVALVETTCCGMAGSFGYQAETYGTSIAMAELSLLPAVRAAGPDTIIAADGFSCRHQIADGTGRKPQHVASVLRAALAQTTTPEAKVREAAE
jgi:FAD/FMN-containing dehydrogenase/Fe-S oxidoreductase